MSEVKIIDKKQWLDILFENNPLNRTKFNEAMAYVRQNFMEFYKEDFFLQLEIDTFGKLLESDELNVPNEEVVFDSVRRWLDFNNLNPDSYLKQILKVVRLPLLPIKYLLDEIEPYVYSVSNCKEEFINTLRYHLFDENKNKIVRRKFQNTPSEKNELNLCPQTPQNPTKLGLKLISIGSDDLNTSNVVEIFEDNSNHWIKPKSIAIDRKNYSVALIDKKLMLIGGTRSPDKDNEPLKIVQSLNLSTGILSTESSLIDARQYAASVVVGEGKTSFLFVFGGQGKDEDLNTVEMWNFMTLTWTLTQPMTEKRSGLAAVVIDNTIYVLGGKIKNNYTSTMEAYNLSDETWQTKASMNEAKAHFCASVFKGFLYAVAGSKGHFLFVKTVERYDPNNDSWQTLANIMATGNVGISSLGNRLICAGGKNSKSVMEYDGKNDKWVKLDDLHFPRAGYLLKLPKQMNNLEFNWNVQPPADTETILSHQLLLLGNQESDKAFTLKVYDDQKNQWTQLSDLDIDKKNFSVACVDENVLIIGGSSVDEKTQLNTVELLNLRTGKFTQIEPLKYQRQHSAAVVVGQGKFTFVYILGGMDNENLLRSVERWDSLSRKWFLMTPMTRARSGHGAVFLKDEIYVIGGKMGNSYDETVEAYNFENDTWTSKASMNNKKAYFGVTSFNNYIYVAGGNRDAETPVNIVERFDPVRNVWTTIANISSKGFVGISGLGNKLICSGGFPSNTVEKYDEKNNRWDKLTLSGTQNVSFLTKLNPNIKIYSGKWIIQKEKNKQLICFGYGGPNHVKIIEKFDIKKNEWTRLKEFQLSFPRSGNSVNIIDNKALFIGGFNGTVHSNRVDGIDFSSGRITQYSPLNKTREYASSVVVQEGNKKILYVLGGYQDFSSTLATVEKWDPSTNKWTEGVPMIHERAGHCSVFLNGSIYAIGGQTKSITFGDVEAFSISKKKWEKKTPMLEARSMFGAATLKDFIYVVGGKNGEELPMNTVERYHPVQNSWITLAKIASSGHVGLCSIGNKLIYAGGNRKYVQEYDENENRWISLPSLDEARGCFLFEFPENVKIL